MQRIALATITLALFSLTLPRAFTAEEEDLRREMVRTELKTRSAAISDHITLLQKQLAEGEIKQTLTPQQQEDLKKKIEMLAADQRELLDKAEKFVRDGPNRAAPDWQDAIRKALEQKVSFEFADVQLSEAIAFIGKIATINVIVDPGLAARKVSISLKAQDMPLHNALDWIGKLADAHWDLADRAVYIAPNNPDPRAGVADFNPRLMPPQGPRALDSSAKIRVKLPSGAEIETEGSVLNEFPEVMQEILTQLHDTTKDGILVYRIDDPAKVEIVEKAHDLLKNLTVNYTVNPDLKLLVVTGDQPFHLRRAQVLLNVLLAPPKPPSRPDRAIFTKSFDRDVMMRMNREFRTPDAGQPGQARRNKLPPDAVKPPEPARENF